MSNSILITGINGFVGTNMYNNYYKNINIVGIDIASSKSDKLCSVYTWDEFPVLPEVDAIIHLAGLAHDTRGTANESQYFEVNVGLTQKIFDHFLTSSAQKFIYFSSVKAVADSVEGEILTEQANPNPRTPYGISKLEAEKYLLSKELPSDKRLYIFRPAMIHGPGNKGNLNLLYSVLKSGIPYPLGAYNNKRSFTSIQNLIFIVQSFLQTDITSGIYNVCDDEALSTTEIVTLIHQSFGRSEKIWNIPKFLINALAKTGDLLHLPFNSERLQKLTETYVVSNAKVKLALKSDALPVGSSEGLLDTLRSFNT
jgi:nucleoside-diphosphate-sugar epimerase